MSLPIHPILSLCTSSGHSGHLWGVSRPSRQREPAESEGAAAGGQWGRCLVSGDGELWVFSRLPPSSSQPQSGQSQVCFKLPEIQVICCGPIPWIKKKKISPFFLRLPGSSVHPGETASLVADCPCWLIKVDPHPIFPPLYHQKRRDKKPKQPR